jgi:hypothetical protein
MIVANLPMNNFFTIRLATPEDAEGILHAHYSAVHETAKQDYSEAILNCWSMPVDAARIAAHRAKMETNQGVISLVAVDATGQILGFAELVPPIRWEPFISRHRLVDAASPAPFSIRSRAKLASLAWRY